MPLFKQLSDFLSGRSSSRPPSSPQTSPDPAPPSDATSDHIQRTETSGAWNSGSPIDYGSLHTSLESLDPVTTAFSNAEGLRHPYEHRPVRPQYRQTVPRSDSGMRRLSGDTTHAKSRQRSEAYDELRLFPPNKWNDPGGIPIVPGQTKSNKPKSPFRPVDTISKGRDSGPVRAQGKPNRLRNSQPGNVTGYAGSERPNKRRRQDTLDSSRGNFTKPSDNDVEHPAQEAPRIAGHPPRMSPTLSQSSGKQKKQRNNRRSKVDEYRSTENIVRPSRIQPSPKRGPLPNFGAPSDDDRDERFTKNATKERRRNNSFIADVDSGAEQERPDKHEILQSVEIINAKSQDPANKTKMGLRHEPEIAAKPRRRVSESRESPDELQGAVTVRPPPAQIGDKRAELGSQRTTGREHQSQDIKPTLFEASGPSKKGKRKNKKTKASEMSNQRSFKAKLVRTGPIEQQASDGKSVEVHVDMTKRTIALCQETDLENVFEAPLSRVRQILKAESPNNKVRLVLSKTSELDNRIDIEFMSFTVKEEFCCLLGEVDVRDKSSEWMDKAFNKAQRETNQSTNGMKRPSSESGLEQVPDKQRDTTKRVKLTDNLRDENGVAAGRQPSPPDAASRERANPSLTAPKPNKSNPSQPESSPSRVSKSATDPGVEIPVKKSASSITTRAMSRLPSATTVVCDDSDDENTQPPLPAVNTEKWHKPLVYPLVGKKKAEVDVYDLDRLRENEFLNDNLIGFYIRFLQDHLERTNSDAAKRVYFFNSFFHDTLMNVPRGKRGINYDGVQKWTRTVDIFSHDYVVVPINESAHWYVAIICNLPSLQGIVQEGLDPNEPTPGEKEPSGPPDSQVQEISETPEPEVATDKDKEEKHANGSGPTRAELARRSLETMRIADGAGKDQPAESPAADQEWPELEASPERPSKTLSSLTENATTPEKLDTKEAAQLPEPSAKPRKQKAKRAGPRYDVCQPIIITFDSLNVPRSPTISSLREYLYEEAKSKKGVEIDKGLIKGMRARDIPLQPNYSDCGLYLLAYLEKFVQDPDVFVRKLLQKEMDSKDDWPPLKSGLLRRRLRKFLDMLYDEQEQLKRHEISDKDTMVNKKPVCYLLGSPVLEGAESESKRSPRKKESSNGSEGLAQAVNSERQSQAEAGTSAGQDKPKEIQRSPVVDTKESRHPEASPEKDVVLVPDSQPEAAPPKTKSKPSKPRRQSPESETQPRTVVHNNEEDAPEGHSPDDGVRVVAVETQVRGTPTR